MEILQKRLRKGPNSTLSEYSVNGGRRLGFIIEDKDRGLTSDMSLEEIARIKVQDQTAIPTGRYRVTLRDSPGFKRLLPWLRDIPGYEYVYCHPGNWIRETRGCLLPGLTWGKEDGEYCARDSRKAFNPLYQQIVDALARKEEVWWEVVNDYDQITLPGLG